MTSAFAPRGPAVLFVPGDRPDRYEKGLDRADAIIVDLEDSVAPGRKQLARDAVAASALDPARVIVRTNAADTAELSADLATVFTSNYRTIMLAKADLRSLAVVRTLAQQARPSGLAIEIIALCETARGVLDADALASDPLVSGLMWGAEDLVASLGGTSSRTDDGSYRHIAQQARSTVRLAAGANGVWAIDAVHLDIADLDGLGAEARDAAALGFAATACIHPSHVPVIRAAYAPTADEVRFASAVLDAAQLHDTPGGVFSFEGKMIDEPVLRHARSVLVRASSATTSDAAG